MENKNSNINRIGGNMTRFKRYGMTAFWQSNVTGRTFGLMDDVSMTYSGNRLVKADDAQSDLVYAGAMEFRDGANASIEYEYDANGNMTRDRNAGISAITYNYLNLPLQMEFADGHVTQYTYAADGRKLQVKYLLRDVAVAEEGEEEGEELIPLDGLRGESGKNDLTRDGGDELEEPVEEEEELVTLTTRDYCGNYIYLNDTIEQILTPTGYMLPNGDYHYYVKDYQGNVRVVLGEHNQLIETNNYYPYGGLIATTFADNRNRYKYSGKELDRANGLDWYDSNARWYNSLTGRTNTMDPKSEKYFPLSPYLWCAGNPVNLFDSDGQEWEDINGNRIRNHRNIRVYIFYDPKSFKKQSFAMYRNLEAKYGKGSVALSSVTTEKEFVQDWENMKGTNIAEVDLNYHGSNQAIHLDYKNNQYITSTGNGFTNTQPQSKRIKAFNVQDLPHPRGNISNVQLNINSCKSNSRTQKPLFGSKQTLMESFANQFDFRVVRGTSVGVSYGWFDLMPHPKYLSSKGWFRNWEYYGTPILDLYETFYMGNTIYYNTGGRK